MASDDGDTLELARSLLVSEHHDTGLDEMPADPPPHEIGALDGFGAVVAGCDVRLSAYVFDRWDGGAEYAAAVRAAGGTAERTARAVVNGRLLLVATAGHGEREQCVLDDVCTAFSGWD